MTEPTIKRTFHDHCEYCGGVFSNDILNLLEKGISPIYCEFCGTEIKNVKKKNSDNLNQQRNKHITDLIPFNTPETVHLPSPQGEVYFDPNFSQIFKDNLILVLSRLIYFNMSNLYQIEELKANKMELSESILNTIADSLEPILTKRIRINFLGKLHHISIKKFEKQVKKLQEKIQTQQDYQNCFKIYIRWLISIVFSLIIEKLDDINLPKFEETILKDLQNYGFNIYSKQIKIDEIKDSLEPKEGHYKFDKINFTHIYKAKLTSELKKLSSKYEDSELLFEIVNKILEDMLYETKRLTTENLSPGYKSNPKYLASVLIYYGLRHENYNSYHPNFKLYGIGDYIRENYEDDNTMKRAISTLTSKVYKFLSRSIRDEILYFPRGTKYVSENIVRKVQNFKQIERNKDFLNHLRACIKKCSKRLPDPIFLYRITLEILKDATKSPCKFDYANIIKNLRYTLPKYFAVGFIFFAINHNSYKNLSMDITTFSNLYFKDFKESNYTVISYLYNFLSQRIRKEINYKPKKRFNPNDKYNEEKVWEIFTKYLELFDPSLRRDISKRAKQLYDLAKSNGFNPNSLSSKNPKYLAFTLLFFSLLNIDNEGLTKEQLYTKVRDSGSEISHTLANKVYESFYIFIKDSLKKTPRRIIDKELFKASLESLKEQAKKEKRFGNIILYDLILNTLNLYENDFAKFTNDLTFISSQGTKRILERLSNPNMFDKEVFLEEFVKDYRGLINNLNVSQAEKKNLYELLNKFENKRRTYYKYEKRKSEKNRREKERYLKYANHFYSHKVRIQRFLLMLGFSPYDGFDIWGNKVSIKGRYRIFANFHHYHYKPEEQSKKDLIFIPVKPSLSNRKGEYLTKKYLTHNVISGLEGNLKRTDISDKVRNKIVSKLQKIEEIIEHNSILIQKAVYTHKAEILYSLENWKKDDVNRAITRLNDNSFLWCKGIEQYLPTAGGYDYERIVPKQTEEIIHNILNKRK